MRRRYRNGPGSHPGNVRTIPTPGTYLRAAWDAMHAHPGEFIDLPPVGYNSRRSLIEALREKYGLTVVLNGERAKMIT